LKVAGGGGRKERRAFFVVLTLPQFGNSSLPALHSTVKFCALCNTAVLATSAGQRFCDFESSNRVYVMFVTKSSLT